MKFREAEVLQAQNILPIPRNSSGCFSSPLSCCRHLAAEEAELGEICDHVFSLSLRKDVWSGFCVRTFLSFTSCLGLVVRSLQILWFFIWAPWMLWREESVRKGIIVLLKARQGSNNQSNAKLVCIEQEYWPAVAALGKGSAWFLTSCF